MGITAYSTHKSMVIVLDPSTPRMTALMAANDCIVLQVLESPNMQ